MSVTSAMYPGTAADNTSVGTIAWANPDYAKTADGSGAVASNTAAGSRYSHYLWPTNFLFDGAGGVPADAVSIDNIKVEVNRRRYANGAVYDEVLKLIVAGAVAGNNKGALATDWPNAGFGIATYDYSVADWGVTPTVAQVRAADFGIALQCELLSAKPLLVTGEVDYIRLTLTYTAASGVVRVVTGIAMQPLMQF